MVGIIFAQPSAKLAETTLIPRIVYWDNRSGKNSHFFFAGYSRKQLLESDAIRVPVPGLGDWFFSAKLFNEFRAAIESGTKWRYSGDCDLLLTNVSMSEAPESRAVLDFSSTINCQLDSMLKDEAIPSVERFFESIFRFAESYAGDDPTWGLSDEQGLIVAGSALKRVVLSLLVKVFEKDIKKVEHFAVKDVALA